MVPFKLSNKPQSRFSGILLVAGILLIAANLRAPFTSIAPVLDQVISHFALTVSQAGFLTTLPLIAFAVISPMAVTLAKKQGLEHALFIALALIMLGITARLVNSSAMLFIGTGIIGVGIAIANVLLPSLIKRDFATRVALMTSCYVLTMGMASGGFSALVFPLSQLNDMGWQVALGSTAIITLISLIVWLAQLGKHTKLINIAQPASSSKNVWHYLLAWQITLMLGLNSFLNYIMIAWLPNILTDTGHSAIQAGAYHGAFQLATALPGLILIPLLATLRDQRALSFLLAFLSSVSALGLLYLSDFALLWTLMLGFSNGACFILGLSFIALRTNESQQAASLSGMSQSVGYLLAAVGPIIAGALHTVTGSWNASLWLCAIAGILCALCGLASGRNTTLHQSSN